MGDNPLYNTKAREAKSKSREEKERYDALKAQKIIGAFNRTFSNVDGQIVLQYIMNSCAYQVPCATVDPHTREVNVHASLHNEALRGLYLSLRELIKPEILKKTEFEDILEKELAELRGKDAKKKEG